MDSEKKILEDSVSFEVTNDFWRQIRILINVANHCLLSIVCFYLIWYVFQDNWSELTCVHSFLCTIGFFLMTEGILLMYSENAPSLLSQSKEKKTNLHWMFQACGVILIVSGSIIEYVFRQQNNKKHWDATHAFWGLTSIIFMGITTISGCSALFSQDLKRFLKPLFNKSAHNVFALTAFVTATVGICYTLAQQKFNKRHDPGNLRIVMVWMLSFMLLFTLIGPLRTLYRYSRIALNR